MSSTAIPRHFNISLENEALYRSLEQAAMRLGMPMQELVEVAIQRQLESLNAERDVKLSTIAAGLPHHVRLSPADEAARFARAEVENEDPLQARRLAADDPRPLEAQRGRPVE